MKKLIAISVVFALVAGAAFAADISAEVIGMTDIIKGDTGKDYAKNADGNVISESHKVGAGGWPGGLKRVTVVGEGENDDGTFGGWFRFQQYGAGDETVRIHGYAWWKPIEQLKFQLGANPDGHFGADGMTRWGFYQVAGDVGIPKENWKMSPSFYGGWAGGHANGGGLLTITPTEGFEINWGIPYAQGGELVDVYMKSTLQFAYTADGLGKFALTYQSGRGNVAAVDGTPTAAGDPEYGWVLNDDDDPSAGVTWGPIPGTGAAGALGGKKAIADPGQLWLFAGLTMIENLEIDIGLGYTLPASGKGVKVKTAIVQADGEPLEVTMNAVDGGTYNAPIAIGLGAHYNAGDFGVKARTQVQLAGKYKNGSDDAYKIPMNILFDVLPYYNISDSLSFLFSAGIDYTAKSGNEIDKESDYAKVGFHVTPYITIKSSWWAPNFYAGIDIRTDGFKNKEGAESKDGTSVINWAVPIGIVFAY